MLEKRVNYEQKLIGKAEFIFQVYVTEDIIAVAQFEMKRVINVLFKGGCGDAAFYNLN